MAAPYIGEIRLFGFSFAPKGWAQCNGQLMSIQQNAALFSILNTFYGGDGVRTFGLPDLRGRTPISTGTGAGLTQRTIGNSGGVENVTLLASQLPQHTHLLNATGAAAAGPPTPPVANSLLATPAKVPVYRSGVVATVALNAGTALPAGGSQPHSNLQPYLSINFCIALLGIFPSRG